MKRSDMRLLQFNALYKNHPIAGPPTSGWNVEIRSIRMWIVKGLCWNSSQTSIFTSTQDLIFCKARTETLPPTGICFPVFWSTRKHLNSSWRWGAVLPGSSEMRKFYGCQIMKFELRRMHCYSRYGAVQAGISNSRWRFKIKKYIGILKLSILLASHNIKNCSVEFMDTENMGVVLSNCSIWNVTDILYRIGWNIGTFVSCHNNNNNNLVWWHCHRVALYKMWYKLKSACPVVSMLNQIDVFLSALQKYLNQKRKKKPC